MNLFTASVRSFALCSELGKILKMRVIVVVLLGCFYLASGEMFRSEEHIQRRKYFLENAEFFEKDFEKKFVPFLNTGVRSEEFNQTLRGLMLNRSIAFTELEDMPPELGR